MPQTTLGMTLRMLFLALKNIQMVKITPCQIPSTNPRSPLAKFPIPSHWGDSPLPLYILWKTLPLTKILKIAPQ